MLIHARLPQTRYYAGTLWVTDDDGVQVFGPVRARGEADNKNAAEHDNVTEDPTKVGGDHPAGLYHVTRIVRFAPADDLHFRKYGPAFLRLEPISGEAREAKEQGRTGLAIHGGALHDDGRLRETFGCLRVDDDVAERLADMVAERAEVVAYTCEVEPD